MDLKRAFKAFKLRAMAGRLKPFELRGIRPVTGGHADQNERDFVRFDFKAFCFKKFLTLDFFFKAPPDSSESSTTKPGT